MGVDDIKELKRHFAQEVSKLEKAHLQAIANVEQQRKTDMAQIMGVLQPIADTYNTATTLGRWLKAGLVVLSVAIGVIIGWRNIFAPKV